MQPRDPKARRARRRATLLVIALVSAGLISAGLISAGLVRSGVLSIGLPSGGIQPPSRPIASGERPSWSHDAVRFLGPPTLLETASLLDAMVRRGSVRELSADPLSDAELATLLWSAQGISAASGARTVPSAGALYPLEVYVVTPDEVLHYVPATASVEVRRGRAPKSITSDAIRGVPASAAYAMVVITGVPDRVTGKYAARGLDYMWMEAGHAAQNLVLAAAALRLGAVTIGAYDDAAIASALGLSPAEMPLYLIAVGRPAG